MYLSIPDVFFVPVRYIEEHILNMNKMVISEEYNFYSNFINKTTKRKEILIGVSLPTQRETQWVRVKEAIQEEAKKQGVAIKIENADTDEKKQASQVENLISQGIDVLILAPVDASTASELVEKAHKAGIKVLNYGRLILNNPDLYIAFNNIRIGELQGQYLIRNVPKGNYIIMSGDPRDSSSRLYKEGAMEYIKPLTYTKDIKIVTDKAVENWDPKNAFKIVSDALIANNNIDAILAPNDATAGGAIQALEEKGLDGKVAVAGQDADLDAIRRIVQKTQLMTVFKDTREEGKIALDAAIKLAKGKGIDVNGYINNGKIDVPSILVTPIAVDKDNIDSVLIKGGYYKKEEIYKT